MRISNLTGKSFYFVGRGQYTGNLVKVDLEDSKRLLQRVTILEAIKDLKIIGFYKDDLNRVHIEESILLESNTDTKNIFELFPKEECVLLGTVDNHLETFEDLDRAYLRAIDLTEEHGGATIIKDKSGLWGIIHVTGELIYKEF